MAVGVLSILIRGDVRDFEKAMARVERRVRRQSRQLQRMGRQMTMGLTVPLLAASAGAIKFSVDMNRGMANVATLIPGNIARVLELKRATQELGIEMGKTTGDMVDGLYQVISAFGDTDETMSKLGLTAKTAVAGLSSTTEALNFLSAVTKGYGDASLAAMKKAADLGFTVVRLGQTDFAQVSAAIGKTIPLAAQLGMGLTEVSAVLGTLTGVTGQAAEVSTQMASALAAFLKQTAPMTQAIANMGYESAKAMISELGLVGALRSLIAYAEAADIPFANLISRKEGMTLAFALAGGQATAFDEKLVAMVDSAGALETAFKEQTQGINKFGFALQQIRTGLEVFAQRVGDDLVRQLGEHGLKVDKIAEDLAKAADAFERLDPKVKMIGGVFTALLIVVGPVVWAMGKLLGNIKKLGMGLLLLRSPVAGAIGVLVGLKLLLDSVGEKMVEIGVNIAEKVGGGLFAGARWIARQVESIYDGMREKMGRDSAPGGGILGGVDTKIHDSMRAWQAWAASMESTTHTLLAAWETTAGGLVDKWDDVFLSGFKRLIGEAIDALGLLSGAAEDALPEPEKLEDWNKQLELMAVKSDKATASIRRWHDGISEPLRNLVAQFEGFEDVIQSWGDAWADTVAEAAVQGKLLQLQFREFLEMIMADIIRFTTQLYVTQPFVRWLQDFMGLPQTSGGIRPGGGGGGGGVSGAYAPGGDLILVPSPVAQGTAVTVNNYSGSEIEVAQAPDTGEIEIAVWSAWRKGAARGEFDGTMKQFGARRQPIGR